LAAENDRLKQETELLREEIRIKDARMARIGPRRRPCYPPPTERMAILELKAARAWSLTQTAKTFLVEPATIASWLKRIDEDEPNALVQLRQPVNRFPDFLRHIVQRLKTLCPSLGKRKIAQMLARAGLHLGSTTVQRIIKENPAKPPVEPAEAPIPTGRVVTADYPDHVHHVDLTVVPTSPGLWASWLPFALPQAWPFAWWVAVVIDHFSRRAMGVAVFKKQPTSIQVRTFLARLYAKGKPKYIICDKGSQFWCQGFKAWCKREGIKPRFGAVGKYGSLAVVERFIRTLKDECTRRVAIPLRRSDMRRELTLHLDWHNEHRPHEFLGGRTPNEVYHDWPSASEMPRVEVRPHWPRGASCAAPAAAIDGDPGQKVVLVVSYHAGRKHLPVIKLKRVA
jgi:putative transposase